MAKKTLMTERVVTRENQRTVESWLRRNARVSIFQLGPKMNGQVALFRVFDGMTWQTVFPGNTLMLVTEGREPGNYRVFVKEDGF